MACRHITNYTVAHELGRGVAGVERIHYLDNHIEVDPALSWFIGPIDELYGKNAHYVHLTRNEQATVESFYRRWGKGIVGFCWGILACNPKDRNIEVCQMHYHLLNSNIRLLLKDKPRVTRVRVEDFKTGFKRFWKDIGATGDLELALAELDTKHNASKLDAVSESAVPAG
jgi:hypothetical protein